MISTLREGEVSENLFKGGYITEKVDEMMTPYYNPNYPNCTYLYFIPKSYPFTIKATGIDNPRIRKGKNFINKEPGFFTTSVTITKSDDYDMFALLNVTGPDGKFSISY